MSDPAPKQLVCGADLTLQTATTTAEITTSDGQLVVDVDGIAGLRELYGLQQSVESTAGNWLDGITNTIGEEVAVRIPVVVCVDGTPVARYDPTREQSRLSRLVGTPFRPVVSGVVTTGVRAAMRSLRRR